MTHRRKDLREGGKRERERENERETERERERMNSDSSATCKRTYSWVSPEYNSRVVF